MNHGVSCHNRSGTIRRLAVLGALAMALSVVPLTAPSLAHDTEPDPTVAVPDACPVDAPASGFTDRGSISDAHVAKVDCAAFLDIVRGFEDNTYRPRLPVRRDQMASFIAQTLDAAGVTLPAGTQNQFTDVPANSPHLNNINRLAEAGIVRGGPGGRPLDQYGPALRTRRDQMASFIMRSGEHAYLLGFEYNDQEQRFADVSETNVHYGYVNSAHDFGIAQGTGGDLYRPGVATTRDQMASFVIRLANFLSVPHTVEITEQTAETVTVGQDITVTATVFDQWGGPVWQTATVRFQANTTPPQTATVQTENGQADFTFTSTTPGPVTVTASIEGREEGNFANATGDSDSVVKTFLVGNAPASQAAEPAGAELTHRRHAY